MKGRALLLLCFLLSLVGRLHAQEVVRPMTETQIKPILTNVWTMRQLLWHGHTSMQKNMAAAKTKYSWLDTRLEAICST